jgi:acetylornithine deacetylase
MNGFRNAISVSKAGELLSELVRISSVNPFTQADYEWPPFGEAELAKFVAGYMQDIGCDVALQGVLPRRENVLATLPGRSGASRALLMEAHLDTVHIDNMRIEPFDPVVRDGRLFGRGSSDAKGSLAAMMLAMKLVLSRGVTPHVTVHLAATVDEEYQWRGVTQLIKSGPAFDAAIVGEPTNLDVVIAHKGALRCRVLTHGRAAHSSRPEQGVNAIEKMAEVVIGLRAGFDARYAGVRHPTVGGPTLSIGLIRGGTEVNTVPYECAVWIDRRVVPGETPEAAVNGIRAIVSDLVRDDPTLEVTLEDPYLVDPALEVPEDSPIVACLTKACRAILNEARVTGVPFGSDASKITAAGTPAIVFGPGSIEDAHGPTESVELWQVARAAEVLAETIATFGAPERPEP